RLAHDAAAQAEDVHVVVLDSLAGRERVLNQGRPDARHLVGCDARPHAAAADRHAAVNLAPCHGPGQRDDVVRIVIVLIERGRTEIDYLETGGAQIFGDSLLQGESTVIPG